MLEFRLRVVACLTGRNFGKIRSLLGKEKLARDEVVPVLDEFSATQYTHVLFLYFLLIDLVENACSAWGRP